MEVESWFAFVVASAVLLVIPGPQVTKTTLEQRYQILFKGFYLRAIAGEFTKNACNPLK